MISQDIRELHKLGFAIHWLRRNSKVPLNSQWQKGPRLSLTELASSYTNGLNVGVRLGSASRIGNNFLAVIDVDVKSKDPRHAKEAEEKLLELFPEALEAPSVASGRGNGSAHYYVVTENPITGTDERKASSAEVVKVKMPSVSRLNKKEKEVLTQEEIQEGIRLRPAWEVSLMSEGRQVVLPPSIHPDSKKPYVWTNEIKGYIPLVKTKSTIPFKNKEEIQERGGSYEFVEVDLKKFKLKPDQLAALKEGEGVEDRSATCYALAMSLLQRGASEIEVISILTDQTYYLGQTGFDHAKTTSRERAAKWIDNYCVKKAKQKVDAPMFEVVEDWQSELKRDQWNKVKPIFKNIVLILENVVSKELIKRNLFSGEDYFALDTPWGATKYQKRSGSNEDTVQVKNWLAEKYQIDVSVSVVEEALLYITTNNSYHPVRDMLDALEWDGVPRVENAFRTYLNARMPEPYLSDVTRKFFQALIARVYEAGIKFDHVVVFEGMQGVGKSSFCRILVGDDFFLDGLPDLGDKDAALNLQGTWLCEMGELSSLHRANMEQAKAFITRQVDKVRPPYGRRRIDIPRQCVFVGTTNDEDYLRDDTGNRRFWPVRVGRCKFNQLKQDRLQILAEAKFLYDFCREDLWLKGEALAQAKEVQESRRTETELDAMESAFLEWVYKPEGERGQSILVLSLDELFLNGPWVSFQRNRTTRVYGSKVLRKAGFQKVHTMYGKRWTPSK